MAKGGKYGKVIRKYGNKNYLVARIRHFIHGKFLYTRKMFVLFLDLCSLTANVNDI